MADKKLANLTKYFICSEHFTDDDFANPEVEDKAFLRLNKIPSFPNPSIFEDNLLQTVETLKYHSDKFINYSKAAHGEPCKRSVSRDVKPTIIENRVLVPAEKEESFAQEVSDEEMLLYEEEFIEEPTEAVEPENATLDDYCRLCVTCPGELIPIFNNKGKLYKFTQCLSLMPQGLINPDDGAPQYVCQECVKKLQSCADVIGKFVNNQNVFESQ